MSIQKIGGINNTTISGVQQLTSIITNMTASQKAIINEQLNPGASSIRHILTGAFGVIEVGKSNQLISIIGVNLNTINTSSYSVSFYKSGTNIIELGLTALLTVDTNARARLFVTADTLVGNGSYDIVINSLNISNDRSVNVVVTNTAITNLNFNAWQVYPSNLGSGYAQGGINTAFCSNAGGFAGTTNGAFEFSIKSITSIPTTSNFDLTFDALQNGAKGGGGFQINASAYIGLSDGATVNKFPSSLILGIDREASNYSNAIVDNYAVVSGVRLNQLSTDSSPINAVVNIKGNSTSLIMNIITPNNVVYNHIISRPPTLLKLQVLIEQCLPDLGNRGNISNINCKIW